MNRKMACALLTATLAASGLGCMNAPQLVRGQSPVGPGTPPAAVPPAENFEPPIPVNSANAGFPEGVQTGPSSSSSTQVLTTRPASSATQIVSGPACPPGGSSGPAASSGMAADGTPLGPVMGTAPGYGMSPYHVEKQSHYLYRQMHGNRPTYGQMPGVRDGQVGFEGGYYSANEGYVGGYPGGRYQVPLTPPYSHSSAAAGACSSGCPQCQFGHACPQGGCPSCGFGCGQGNGSCLPRHYHTYSYHWPQNQTYPSPTMPAGFVQNPYYTLRGPTDFFMK